MSETSESERLPIEAALSSEATSTADYETLLNRHQERLAALGADGNTMDAARIQLDIAEVLIALARPEDAWSFARTAFDTCLREEQWQDAVEACEVLYQCDQPASISALGQGVWLAVTYPVSAQTTVTMLNYIIDETPDDSDGAAVAAAAAHYVVELRCNGAERDNIGFLTQAMLGRVANRHSGIEDQTAFEHWLERLRLHSPQEFLPRLALVIDVLVQDDWWFDREALRARLPVN